MTLTSSELMNLYAYTTIIRFVSDRFPLDTSGIRVVPRLVSGGIQGGVQGGIRKYPGTATMTAIMVNNAL